MCEHVHMAMAPAAGPSFACRTHASAQQHTSATSAEAYLLCPKAPCVTLSAIHDSSTEGSSACSTHRPTHWANLPYKAGLRQPPATTPPLQPALRIQQHYYSRAPRRPDTPRQHIAAAHCFSAAPGAARPCDDHACREYGRFMHAVGVLGVQCTDGCRPPGRSCCLPMTHESWHFAVLQAAVRLVSSYRSQRRSQIRIGTEEETRAGMLLPATPIPHYVPV